MKMYNPVPFSIIFSMECTEGGFFMNHFPRLLVDYFKNNIGQYIFLTIVLIVGVVVGSIAVNVISDNQLINLLGFINGFLANVNNLSIDNSSVFYVSLSNNLKTALLMILSGLSIIGFPIILFLIFFRGFVLGFTVGFLIGQLGLQGIVLAVLSILPQNLIILPCIISIGVTSLTFSITVIKNRIRNYSEDYSQMLAGYLVINLFFGFLLMMSSLIEGYISPIFIKLYTRYLVNI